jgi:prevent-host-death family protein
MTKVSVTELRQNLPAYLARARKGEEIEVAVHGTVIARIVPEKNTAEVARAWLISLREKAWVGDVISPSGEVWDAEK